MKNKLFSIIAALLMLMCFVTGCAKEADKPVETPAPTPTIKVLGEEMEGSTAVELTNKTGKEISEIYIKTSDAEEEALNLLDVNETIALNETFKLIFNDVSDEAEAAGNSEKALSPEYTVCITFTDGTSGELHAFPVTDIKEGTISAEEDTVYLIYKSVSSDEEVNTLEAEKAIIEMAEAEAAAASQSSTPSKPASGSSYKAPVQNTAPAPQPETPSSNDTSASGDSGDEDGCLSDGLTY